MSKNAFNARPLYGMDCVQCGDNLIAPESSECAGERHVRHIWHCDCGCRFEETSYLCADAGAMRVEMRRHDILPPRQPESRPAADAGGLQSPVFVDNFMLIVRSARAAICRV